MGNPKRIYWVAAFFTLLALGFSQAVAAAETFHLDRTYAVSPRDTLFLVTHDADVVVRGEERKDVRLLVDYRSVIKTQGEVTKRGKFHVRVTPTTDGLKIEDRHPAFIITGNVSVTNQRYEIRIQAPRTMNLHVRCADDNYVIRDFWGTVDLRMGDGKTLLSGMNGKQFAIGVADGDCRLQGGGGTLHFDVGDGNLFLERGAFTRIEGTAGDGSIDLETALQDQGTYSVRIVDGDLRFAVLRGGGLFCARVADGVIRASPAFRPARQGTERHCFSLQGGSARVTLRAGDGAISLEGP